MVHTNVKKAGRIPNGGGWRIHGRGSDQAKTVDRAKTSDAKRGYVSLHSIVDGFSRLAYTEPLPEKVRPPQPSSPGRRSGSAPRHHAHPTRGHRYSSWVRPWGSRLLADGARIIGVTGACLPSLVHRSERAATPGLLITLAGGVTAEMAFPEHAVMDGRGHCLPGGASSQSCRRAGPFRVVWSPFPHHRG